MHGLKNRAIAGILTGNQLSRIASKKLKSPGFRYLSKSLRPSGRDEARFDKFPVSFPQDNRDHRNDTISGILPAVLKHNFSSQLVSETLFFGSKDKKGPNCPGPKSKAPPTCPPPKPPCPPKCPPPETPKCPPEPPKCPPKPCPLPQTPKCPPKPPKSPPKPCPPPQTPKCPPKPPKCPPKPPKCPPKPPRSPPKPPKCPPKPPRSPPKPCPPPQTPKCPPKPPKCPPKPPKCPPKPPRSPPKPCPPPQTPKCPPKPPKCPPKPPKSPPKPCPPPQTPKCPPKPSKCPPKPPKKSCLSVFLPVQEKSVIDFVNSVDDFLGNLSVSGGELSVRKYGYLVSKSEVEFVGKKSRGKCGKIRRKKPRGCGSGGKKKNDFKNSTKRNSSTTIKKDSGNVKPKKLCGPAVKKYDPNWTSDRYL